MRHDAHAHAIGAKKKGTKDTPSQHQFKIKLVPHPTGSSEENHCAVSLEVGAHVLFMHVCGCVQMRQMRVHVERQLIVVHELCMLRPYASACHVHMPDICIHPGNAKSQPSRTYAHSAQTQRIIRFTTERAARSSHETSGTDCCDGE